MVASVRDGVQSSFPGCRWTAGAAPEGSGAATITIIVHRLGVEEHDRYQYAAAEWTVTASTASGSTLTEFEADEEESRPAYSGADEEALNEAFRKALQRTVRGPGGDAASRVNPSPGGDVPGEARPPRPRAMRRP